MFQLCLVQSGGCGIGTDLVLSAREDLSLASAELSFEAHNEVKVEDTANSGQSVEKELAIKQASGVQELLRDVLFLAVKDHCLGLFRFWVLQPCSVTVMCEPGC